MSPLFDHILLVANEAGLVGDLTIRLEAEGWRIDLASDGGRAMELLSTQVFHLVILDLDLAQTSGLEIFKSLQESHPHTPVVIITGFGSVGLAVEAMRLGAFDFQEKPLNLEHLVLTASRALDKAALHHAYDYLRRQQPFIYKLQDIVAQSPVMRRVLDQVARVAPTDSTVILTGESGTGKTLVAGAIHANSPRRERTLVTVNCAALPETLLESELFGHEKGAFTGAHQARAGRVQQAHGGTLFLDEVGDMAPATQAKILRAIEDKVIHRVGGAREIQVDVRIIAATNCDLAKAVQEGAFRQDLFYRLHVAAIHLPPLRDRREDIAALAELFMARVSAELKRPPLALTPEVKAALAAHAWPGNIRELRNAVERALLFAPGPEASLADLGLTSSAAPPARTQGPSELNLENLERQAILAALERSEWVQSRAAKLLGVSPRAMVYKLAKHAIDHPRLSARRRR